jgi:hypothetical protein
VSVRILCAYFVALALRAKAENLRGCREVEEELTTDVVLLGRADWGDDGSLAGGAGDRFGVGRRVRP